MRLFVKPSSWTCLVLLFALITPSFAGDNSADRSELRAPTASAHPDPTYKVEAGMDGEIYPVFANYLTDNWRAFRTWGVSAISPWEHEHFWKLRAGVERCGPGWHATRGMAPSLAVPSA